MPINGIGPALSNRIVKYRNRLGGFVSKNQLYEVYGLDSGLVAKNLSLFELDTIILEKTDVAHASFKELISHPYLDKAMTIKLLDWQKFGMNKSDWLSTLKKDNSEWERVIPYLKFG